MPAESFDAPETLPKEGRSQVALRQLQDGIPGVPNEATTDLEEPMLETRQEPALDGERHDQPAQQIAEVIGNDPEEWVKRCPGVVRSLREGGDELLTFFSFPKAQWTTLRTTNTIERLHEECRRRVKTQGSLPSEAAAVVLLFSLVASGQIKLRRIDGWRKIPAVLSQHTAGTA
jgi:hypothetical protein